MRKVLTVTLSLFFLFLVSSMGNASEVPGVTDKAIKIGYIVDLTASNAYYGKQTLAAMRALYKQVNGRGGIHGRKLDLVVHEAGDNPVKQVAAYKYLVSKHDPFMFGQGIASSALTAVFPFVQGNKIPLTAVVSLSSTMHNPFKRYVFSTHAAGRDCSIVALDYLMNNLIYNDPRFKDREIRLGINYQDDEYGKDYMRGWRLAAKKYGLKIVAEESFKRGSVDVASQVLNLRRMGANYVYQTSAMASIAATLQEAHRLGYHPQFIGDGGMCVKKFIDVVQEAAEGAWGVTFTAHAEENSPGMKRLKNITKKYQPDARMDMFYIWGWVNSMVGIEGLERAGRNLTREGLIEALETFKDRPFSTNGLSGDIIYSSKSHKGGGPVRIWRADLKKGDCFPFTDWMRPSIAETIDMPKE